MEGSGGNEPAQGHVMEAIVEKGLRELVGDITHFAKLEFYVTTRGLAYTQIM